MTALDQTAPPTLTVKWKRDLEMAIAAAAACTTEAGAEFLADFEAGVGGLSFGIPDPQDGQGAAP